MAAQALVEGPVGDRRAVARRLDAAPLRRQVIGPGAGQRGGMAQGLATVAGGGGQVASGAALDVVHALAGLGHVAHMAVEGTAVGLRQQRTLTAATR